MSGQKGLQYAFEGYILSKWLSHCDSVVKQGQKTTNANA